MAAFFGGELILWIAVLIVAVIVEIGTVQIVSIWFAVGAFAAIVSMLFGAPLLVQIIVFVAVSFILILVTRPVVSKMMKKTAGVVKVNDEVGKRVRAVETVTSVSGRVVLGDVHWMAVTEGEKTVAAGSEAVVKSVKETVLVVEPV